MYIFMQIFVRRNFTSDNSNARALIHFSRFASRDMFHYLANLYTSDAKYKWRSVRAQEVLLHGRGSGLHLMQAVQELLPLFVAITNHAFYLPPGIIFDIIKKQILLHFVLNCSFS